MVAMLLFSMVDPAVPARLATVTPRRSVVLVGSSSSQDLGVPCLSDHDVPSGWSTWAPELCRITALGHLQLLWAFFLHTVGVQVCICIYIYHYIYIYT